jgi:hypothetical protein
VTSAFFIWSAISCLRFAVVFIFMCVTGYAWLFKQLGAVFGDLAMAGVFLLIALVAIAIFFISRSGSSTRQFGKFTTTWWPCDRVSQDRDELDNKTSQRNQARYAKTPRSQSSAWRRLTLGTSIIPIL